MPKSLSSIWLKSIRRMGKVQQSQSRKLLKSFTAPAAPVRRAKLLSPVKAVKIAKLVKTPKAAPTRSKVVRTPALMTATLALAGTWRKSYFSAPGNGRQAPGRRMLYWLYLPAMPALPAGAVPAPRPLVVMLHGCQQTAEEFATATRMNALAARKGFAVLYPQQSASADSHRCWHWYKRDVQKGQGEVKTLASLIEQVQIRHGLDPSRTYLAGLSAGAALANIVALRHPQLIAALGLHSAPVFGTADSPMSAYTAMQQGSSRVHAETALAFAEESPHFPGMPAMLIHGQRDSVVRRVNMDQLSQQFEVINAGRIDRAEPVHRKYAARMTGRSPRHAYETVTYYAGRKPQLVRCEITKLGHAWSGGDDSVNFSTPEGPDASLLLWNFFALHRRLRT